MNRMPSSHKLLTDSYHGWLHLDFILIVTKVKPKFKGHRWDIPKSLQDTAVFHQCKQCFGDLSFFLSSSNQGQKGENLHFMKLENVTGISLSDLALLGLNTLKSVRIECQKTFGKEGIDFFMDKNLLFHLWLLNSLWESL